MRDPRLLALGLLAATSLTWMGCGESVAEATEEGSELLSEALDESNQTLGETVDLPDGAAALDPDAEVALGGLETGTGTIGDGDVEADGTALASADGATARNVPPSVTVVRPPTSQPPSVTVVRPPTSQPPSVTVVRPPTSRPPSVTVVRPPAPSRAPVVVDVPAAATPPPAASRAPVVLTAPAVATRPPASPAPSGGDTPWWKEVGNTVAGTYRQAVSNTTDFFEENLGTPGSGPLPARTADGGFAGMPPRSDRFPDSQVGVVRGAPATFMPGTDPLLEVAREAAARGLFADTRPDAKRRLMEFVTTRFSNSDDQVRFLIEGAALTNQATGLGMWGILYGLRSTPGFGGHKAVQAAEHFGYAYENVESGDSSQAMMLGGVGLHAAKDLTVDNIQPIWRSITNTWDDVFGDGKNQKPVNWDAPSAQEMKWGYLGTRIGALKREGKHAEARELFEGVL